jgi:CHAT domain-containing protein
MRSAALPAISKHKTPTCDLAPTRRTELKTMSERGTLANYRVQHFATHGAVAGAFLAKSELGLILTPPEIATARDDGFLSASEVAGLKLDADLVILFACYTAAGGAENAEALSGKASGFFYAGARALLRTQRAALRFTLRRT